ncbi:DgyrCDS7770 [Dimorphilus gyrociliatus]|uniref:DgyrCDS7770 n=2 Tax=Spiralia TaxID=2697495 RepID=A0A7I8VS62_9ANNE|nr:DgyrCDS7770 [Dimorphilus gyrociliatus]
MGILDKIAEIESEMARTQRNKATMGHLGLLKARLAKLRRELIEPKGGGGGAAGEGFDVAKTGDARIGFVGFPSVGKSTLLTNLAGVYSEVAAYEFTTLTTVPGVIRYKGARVQLLDLPGIIEGAKDGKGRGKQVIAVARTCSLIFIVLDVLKPLQHKRLIEYELEGFGIRLNKKPPNIYFKRKDKGGVNLTSTVGQSELDLDTVKSILGEYRIHNADVTLRYDASVEDLVDVIEGNRIYIPCVYVLNKIDQISIEELDIISKVPHCVPISAHHKWNFDDLLEKMWEYLSLTRIYTKPKGQLPDYKSPVVLRLEQTTVEDFCNKLHRSIMKEFKYALVWGSSVKHQPQKVGKDHVLEDEDVVQIVKKATNSGKTTLCNRLTEHFGHKSTTLSMDDFYLDNHDCRLDRVPELNCYNWENMNSVDISAMTEKLTEYVSLYENSSDVNIIFVEGILVFNYEPLLTFFNKKYFLLIDKDECRRRRSTRIYDPPDVPGYFDLVVWPEYLNIKNYVENVPEVNFIDGTNNAKSLFQKVAQDIQMLIDKCK